MPLRFCSSRLVSLTAATLIGVSLMALTACSHGDSADDAQPNHSSTTSNNTDYTRLASPTLAPAYLGKKVTIQARFLSEWKDLATYRAVQIQTEHRIFLNHRAPDYVDKGNDFGSSDLEFPPFVMSVDASFAEQVLKLKHGDLIEVTGTFAAVPQPIDAARFELGVSSIRVIGHSR